MDMEATVTSPTIGRGRKKLIRDRAVQSPEDSNLNFHVENMTPQQLAEARHTIVEKPNIITVVDRNGNTDSIKIDKQNK